jgi:hypothetical protein
MKAIYYMHQARLSYLTWQGTSIQLVSTSPITLKEARVFLREHIIQTEIIQSLEIFP